jgi:hypothetical protein
MQWFVFCLNKIFCNRGFADVDLNNPVSNLLTWVKCAPISPTFTFHVLDI